jgi:drug/metabolite transporter (DMT)-like permease
MSRRPLAAAIAIIVVLGCAVIVVAGATGAHVHGKPASPRPWESAAIAAVILVVVSCVALAVGARVRRRRG